MTSHLKAKIALTAGAALFGILAFSGPADAADVYAFQVSTSGGDLAARSHSYGANGAVQVCDLLKDGHGVAAYYTRLSGYHGLLRDHDGVGSCQETPDIPSDPIVVFNACINVDRTDLCSTGVHTWR